MKNLSLIIVLITLSHCSFGQYFHNDRFLHNFYHPYDVMTKTGITEIIEKTNTPNHKNIYRYDNKGRLIEMHSYFGKKMNYSYFIDYDSLNNIKKLQEVNKNFKRTYTFSYSYDKTGDYDKIFIAHKDTLIKLIIDSDTIDKSKLITVITINPKTSETNNVTRLIYEKSNSDKLIKNVRIDSIDFYYSQSAFLYTIDTDDNIITEEQKLTENIDNIKTESYYRTDFTFEFDEFGNWTKKIAVRDDKIIYTEKRKIKYK